MIYNNYIRFLKIIRDLVSLQKKNILTPPPSHSYPSYTFNVTHINSETTLKRGRNKDIVTLHADYPNSYINS